MIYIVCVGIVCLSAYIGKILTRALVERDEFFKEINLMLEYFKNNIEYRHCKIAELFKNYKHVTLNNSVYQKIHDYYFDNKEKRMKFTFLKAEEKERLNVFFKEFGNGDKNVEVNNIVSLMEYVKNKKIEASEVRKKNEGLIYKVSIAVGVVLSIIII